MYSPDSPIMNPNIQVTDYLVATWFRLNNIHLDSQKADQIATAISKYAISARVDPIIVAAQVAEETGYWTSKYALERNNPAGLGALTNDPDKAIYFDSIDAGIKAQVAHLCTYTLGNANPYKDADPRWQATVDAGWVGSAFLLRDLTNHWADDDKYADNISAIANNLNNYLLVNDGVTMPSRKFHVALSYGHNNTSGGDASEIKQTPQIGSHVKGALINRGIEVRVVQDEKGNGLSLDGVAQTVVDWDNGGWPVDLYMEVHSSGDGKIPGVFGIYPDATGDVDNDAKRIGADAAQRISDVTGVKVRTSTGYGFMSEKQTGVGLSGYRLGIFRVTAPIKASTTRMIIEFGAHDLASDYNAIMGNLDGVGDAVADAFAAEAARLGFDAGNVKPQNVDVTPVVTPDPGPDFQMFDETGHKVSGGFYQFFQKYGGVRIFGFPISDEFTEKVGDKDKTVQYFQRARFEWSEADKGFDPDNWDVMLGLVGQEVYNAKNGG